MTEMDWLHGDDPEAMIDALQGHGSERKFHLVACAFQRRMKPELASWIEDVERALDGLPVQHGWDGQEDPNQGYCRFEVNGLRPTTPGWNHVANIIHPLMNFPIRPPWMHEYTRLMVDLLHDVFGNPFRPCAVQERWRTPTVLELARAIYAGRTFDRLPALADALEEAGCSSRAVLGHLRTPGLHVRGCWAVDLVVARA